jgi:hypothetical protein
VKIVELFHLGEEEGRAVAEEGVDDGERMREKRAGEAREGRGRGPEEVESGGVGSKLGGGEDKLEARKERIEVGRASDHDLGKRIGRESGAAAGGRDLDEEFEKEELKTGGLGKEGIEEIDDGGIVGVGVGMGVVMGGDIEVGNGGREKECAIGCEVRACGGELKGFEKFLKERSEKIAGGEEGIVVRGSLEVNNRKAKG